MNEKHESRQPTQIKKKAEYGGGKKQKKGQLKGSTG